MKDTRKNISLLLVVLASLLFLFVGCSDMMVKMGEIVLQVEAEDTIRTSVDTYTITGNLEGGKSLFTQENVKPGEDVVISNITLGTWSFTVVAYDGIGTGKGNEIGRGTKKIVLVEGQKMGLKVPVEFEPIQLTIDNIAFVDQMLTKEYDGNTGLTFEGDDTYTVDETQLVGLHTYIDTDGTTKSDNVLIKATATYADKTAVADKTLNVVYSLIYSEDTAVTNKYVAPVPFTVTNGTITRKQLTITEPIFPKSKTRVYNGTKTLSVNAGSLIGVVDGDDVSVIATATYANKDTHFDKEITLTYVISGADAANYIKPVDDTTFRGSITKKPLLFSVEADGKTYDGNAVSSGRITLAEVLSSDIDKVGATGTFAFSDKQAGSDKSVSVTDITLTGDEKDNYSLGETTASTVATISKKPLSNEGTSLLSKVYDQKVYANYYIDHELSGMVTVDGVDDNITLTANSSYQDANVGTGKTITVRYTLTGGSDVGNYTKPEGYTVHTGEITPIQLTVGAPIFIKTKKIYDGDTNFSADSFSIATATLKGIIGTDVTLLATAAYDDAKTGNGKSITVMYSLEDRDGDAANYLAPVPYTTKTGVVEKKELTVTSGSTGIAATKTYDGNLSAEVTEKGTLEGLVSVGGVTDDVILVASASYSDKNVSTAGKSIRVEYTLSGADADNYRLKSPTDTTGYTAMITRKALSVFANTTQVRTMKPYDGTDTASVVERGTLKGVLGSDQVVLSAEATYLNGVDAGENKSIMVSYSLTDGADKDNYSIPESDATRTFSGSIKPIQLTVAPLGLLAASKTYDGGTSLDIPSITPECFLPGDAVGVTAT
ncbi:MAG TPA: YDG domain-containing protein, partial [Sphaerochaeta sp.]|nr:YDG domain-containing protein [Sphaerochaeta sp.]